MCGQRMSQHIWPDCPEDVRRQVDSLTGGLCRILADNLIGNYLHGSLAMGCFHPQRSDIDLLVVTRNRMTVDEKWHVAELLLRWSANPRPIEISFLTLHNLHPWRYPTPFDFHFSEDWRERFKEQMADDGWRMGNDEPRTDADLAAHITVTLHRGICLYGRPIADVFPSVPTEHYLASIVDDFEWAKDRIAANPVYFILNACRVLAYLREGRICSKDEGGEWALHALPAEVRPIVAWALDVYRGNRDDEQFRVEFLAMVARYIEEQIRRKSGP